MSDFNYDSVAFYDFGILSSVVPGPAALTDFDNDNTFESGDVTPSGDTYIGITNVAGFNMPVFDDGSTISVYNSSGGLVTFPQNLPSIVPGVFGFCFATDTQIATPSGAAMVQDLQIGDVISTATGGSTRVLWVGRQTLMPAFNPAARRCLVRIKAGALGNNLPARDLRVTSDHGMLIDNLIVTAGALINGSTIDWEAPEALGDRYTVYHVETENHEVLLAEGAPAETFVDYAARRAFDN